MLSGSGAEVEWRSPDDPPMDAADVACHEERHDLRAVSKDSYEL
jgi:hypothetical protein